MTVTANTTRNDYTAGSAQSEYDYTFQLNEAADVDVYLDGVKQTLNTHYVVQNVGNASGGTIVFTLEDENGDPIHPTQGAVINIVMAMDLDRDTNYQPSGAFLAADVNNDFDRLWLATNQQQTAVNRALRLKDTDVTTSSMELPLKDDRKGKLLAFNATTGDPEATTNNQSNWDTAYNNMITSASFTGGNYTLTQQDGGTISTSLDGRYLQLTGGTLTGTLTTSNIAVASGSSLSFANAALVISSNGTESIIRETGSGDLSIEGENLYLRSSPTANYLSGTAGAEVKLYHNNSEKLATTSTGISVTGNLDFGDNEEARFGDSADLKIYHNGTSSIIQDSGTGDLALLGTNLAFANGSGTSYYAAGTEGGAFTLYYNGSEKLATTSGGISVTGTLTATGYNDSNWNAAYNDKINSASFDTSNGVLTLTQQDGGTVTVDLDGRYSTDTGIALGDNQKATFGDSDDLEIYHDGSHSYISDTGTGRLNVKSNVFRIYNAAGDEISANFVQNGAVSLYHDNAKKLETTATGIDVTGTVTADGLGLAAGSTISSAGGLILTIDNDNSSSSTYFEINANGNDKSIARFVENGDISFYEDTGTTAKFFWDASAERLGIGTTSPAANLHVDASAPEFRLSQSGTAKVRLRTTGDNYINTGQNLGIGTTSPNGKLEVSSADFDTLYLTRSTAGSATILMKNSSNNGGLVQSLGNGGLSFFSTVSDSSSERMRIDASGNVGIGTTSPAQPLHIDLNGTSTAYQYLQLDGNGSGGSTSGQAGIGFRPIGAGNNIHASINALEDGNATYKTKLTFNVNTSNSDTAPTEAMRIDASGRLGIGTTSPSQLLHVNGTARATTVLSGDGTASAPSYSFSSDTNTGMFKPFPDTLAFSEGGVERMRINSTGNVGIGVTTMYAKLHVGGSFLSTGPVSCGSGGTISSAGYQNTPAFIIKSWTSTSTTYFPMLRFATSGSTEVGTIKSNNTSTQYNTSSDVRLKENIRNAEDAGAKIDAIQIRQFDWKNGGEHQDYGVIAQELKEVAPEAVSEGNDEEEMWGVDYSKLVPTLIKEIQSLRNRVAELEKK